MRRLYDIDADIESCIDEETGEIDEERLSALSEERDKKIEAVALWVKELAYDVEAYKAESKRITNRLDKAKKTIESLKKWLAYATDGEKFHSEKVDVTFRKSKALKVEKGAYIPPTYIKVKKEVDNAKLKKDILNGVEIEGCEVVENINTQVK